MKKMFQQFLTVTVTNKHEKHESFQIIPCYNCFIIIISSTVSTTTCQPATLFQFIMKFTNGYFSYFALVSQHVRDKQLWNNHDYDVVLKRLSLS